MCTSRVLVVNRRYHSLTQARALKINFRDAGNIALATRPVDVLPPGCLLVGAERSPAQDASASLCRLWAPRSPTIALDYVYLHRERPRCLGELDRAHNEDSSERPIEHARAGKRPSHTRDEHSYTHL